MGLLDRFKAKGAYSSISQREREHENAERKVREEDRKKELRRIKEDAEYEEKKKRVKRNVKEKYSPKKNDAGPFSGNPFAGFGSDLSATDSGRKRSKSTSPKPKKGKKGYVVVDGKAYEKGSAKKKREPREQKRGGLDWADMMKAP